MKHLIFFQGGGGKDDHQADAALVASLGKHLGPEYSVHYPLLDDDETPDLGRRRQIGYEISVCPDDVIIIGHSLGASMLLAYLSENKTAKRIRGIFLLATPFWQGDEDWVTPYKLKPGFPSRIDKTIPLFFYHCRDDGEVPFEHLNHYKRHLPWATFREIATGGHQMNDDLTIVATDIKSL